MYTCPDCGSEMKFDPTRQKLYCEFCGNEADPRTISAETMKKAEENQISPEEAMAVHRAAQLGEEEVTPARQRYEAYMARKAEQEETQQKPMTEVPQQEPMAETPQEPEKKAGRKKTDAAAAGQNQSGAVEKEPPRKSQNRTNTDGEKAAARPTYTARVFTCPSCGAELISTEETVATFCSYCGSSVLLESRIEEADCPDYVIPFQITREACEKAYRKTLRKALFVPSEMKQDTQIERFRGIYMPYWIYSFEKDGVYKVRGSKSRRRGDYVYTSHYQLESHLTAACKGLSYDASSSFSDNLSEAIAPFDTRDSREFTTGYLSGFYADRGDVASGIYQSEAKEAAAAYVARKVGQDRTYKKYHVTEDSMMGAFRPRQTQARMGMFPVWFLGCRSHDGKRISYAVVNGQTGRVAAELPIDMKKYLLGSLVLAVPLFLLLNLFLTLTPTKALVFALVLALTSLWLSNRQLNQVYTRDLRLDDLGLWSVSDIRNPAAKPKMKKQNSVGGMFLRILGLMGLMWGSMLVLAALMALGPFRSAGGIMVLMVIWIVLIFMAFRAVLGRPVKSRRKRAVSPAPMKEKWGTLYKPLLAMGIAVLVLIWNPVSDLYYYAGAVVSLGCVAWSFLDIIREHNLLTTRKLPQLGRRGGDENA